MVIFIGDPKFAMHGMLIPGLPKLLALCDFHSSLRKRFMPKLHRHLVRREGEGEGGEGGGRMEGEGGEGRGGEGGEGGRREGRREEGGKEGRGEGRLGEGRGEGRKERGRERGKDGEEGRVKEMRQVYPFMYSLVKSFDSHLPLPPTGFSVYCCSRLQYSMVCETLP